jgi:hypothetical protein
MGWGESVVNRSDAEATRNEPSPGTIALALAGAIVGAANDILIDNVCPICGRLAKIRCQTHVATSYAGDNRGRFCLEEYRLGEQMRWWAPDHPEFLHWRERDRCIDPDDDPHVAEEACYSHCLSCRADLVVVVRYRDLVPVEILGISPETEWPTGYYR